MVKTTIQVEGMKCNMCEAHMNDAIKNAFAVKSVTSSHTEKKSEIISEAALDADKLREVVTATGFTPGEISSEPYKKPGLLGLFK